MDQFGYCHWPITVGQVRKMKLIIRHTVYRCWIRKCFYGDILMYK